MADLQVPIRWAEGRIDTPFKLSYIVRHEDKCSHNQAR